MKFVLSYSGGKDSILAMKRAMDLGHEPAGLLTTCPPEGGISNFHKLPLNLLETAARSIGVPLVILRTQGEAYAVDFEAALGRLRQQGVELAVFGDIDLDQHLEWCTARCDAAGLIAMFPLWQEQRAAVVADFIRQGFRSMITVVNTRKMGPRFLGRILTSELAGELATAGVDVCGEGGEYHSFVIDGPIFQWPVQVSSQGVSEKDGYRWLNLTAADASAQNPPEPPVGNSHRFFRNVDCQYFPCHQGVEPTRFNCLFCYCPLYLMGPHCGGKFRYVGHDRTVKDCSACDLPHHPAYYDEILRRLMDAAAPRGVAGTAAPRGGAGTAAETSAAADDVPSDKF